MLCLQEDSKTSAKHLRTSKESLIMGTQISWLLPLYGFLLPNKRPCWGPYMLISRIWSLRTSIVGTSLPPPSVQWHDMVSPARSVPSMQICVPRRGCEENPGALNFALNIQPPDFLHILGEAHSAIFYLQGLNLSTARLVGWVAHVILVSAQVLLVLTLGLWTMGLRTWAWQ